MVWIIRKCLSNNAYLQNELRLFDALVSRVSQSLIMGTVSIANALAFSPNLQKGIEAAGKVLELLKRVPAIKDEHGAKDKDWVWIIIVLFY